MLVTKCTSRLFIGWTSATDAWIYWEGLPDHGNLNVCRWFEWWVRVWSYMFTRWLSSHLITFVWHSVALSMPEIQNMRKLLLTRWKSWVVSINSLVSAKELGGKCWRYIYSCKELFVVVPVSFLLCSVLESYGSPELSSQKHFVTSAH